MKKHRALDLLTDDAIRGFRAGYQEGQRAAGPGGDKGLDIAFTLMFFGLVAFVVFSVAQWIGVI